MSSSTTPTAAIGAGVACAAINPPPGLSLAGFPGERANTGGGLDLCARAIVFAEADASAPAAALLVLDNLGVSPDIVAAIRDNAGSCVDGLDGGAVMVAATHTHSAPGLRHYGGANKGKSPVVDPQYVQQVVAAAGEVIAQAWAARRAVRMRVGCAEAELHHNRRVVGDDGKASNVWLDLEGEHTGYTNPAVPFVVFDDAATGDVTAMIVSYGCHPVTRGPGNVKTSPDYPGYFVRKLEEATGAPVVVHVTGAGADINPRNCLLDTPEQAQWMGETLAAKVLGTLDNARPCDAAPIRSASVALDLELGPNARTNYSNRAADSADGKTLRSEVQALRLGDWVAVTAPGELFSQIGSQMEQASASAHTMVVSYADDYLGYLFTDAALAEGGYEPANAISENIERPLIAAATEAINATL